MTLTFIFILFFITTAATAKQQDETTVAVPKVDERDSAIVYLTARRNLWKHRAVVRSHVIHRLWHQLRELREQTQRSTAPAVVSSGHNWDAVAQCESSGNWHAGDGLGPDVTGGLQIATSTWLAYGGGRYASKAMYALREQQIAIAERVLAGQGAGAWPNCGRYL